MGDKLAALQRLSWSERRWLAVSLVLLPATMLALRVVPVRTLRRIAERRRGPEPRLPDRARADRIAHMVAAAATYGPFPATCLPQALVLQWLLRRHGMHGELRFGATTAGGELSAHCWIELDGEPLIDSPEVQRQYAMLEPSAAVSRWRR